MADYALAVQCWKRCSSATEHLSEKTAHNFWPSLPVEYVSSFVRRTDIREGRCRVTDTQTQLLYPRCACAPRVMKLGTLMYHVKRSSKQKLQVCKNNKQPQAIKMVFVPLWLVLQQWNLVHCCTMMGVYRKMKLRKQQQTASGNKYL